MTIISRQETVPFTPAQMYTLVDEIEAYPEFIQWCQKSEIHHRNEDEVRASLMVASAGLKKTFTTHNRLQKNKMIEIRLVDGPFKHLEGFWRFEEAALPQHCKISFDLEFEFVGMLDFILGPIFQQMTHQLVDAFTQRAHALYGADNATD